MLPFEVGTIARCYERNEVMIPSKALEIALFLANEVHKEMIVCHKHCYEYCVNVEAYGMEPYNISQKIKFVESCDSFAPFASLLSDFFQDILNKGYAINSIYVAAKGVHTLDFGVYL